jgi:hypothetical protein
MNYEWLLMLYLVGCALTFLLIIFRTVFLLAIGWLLKENIYRSNLKKICPPDEKTFKDKALGYIFLLGFESLLSWINVPVLIWNIFKDLVTAARNLLSSHPEDFKRLTFPLRNNPEMTREAVWAYGSALEAKVGVQLTEEKIFSSLNELQDFYPSFNRFTALQQFGGLNIVDQEMLDRLSKRIRNPSSE